MSPARARLLNVGLRLATLGIRFLFIFLLARYLAPADVGYYGLFSAAIGYALMCVGLDFYVYVTREILHSPPERRGTLLKSQAALAAVMYLAATPLILLFLRWTGWPAALLWLFLPLLILEHINQEIYRLLIALSKQLTASLLLFLRQGSWGVLAGILLLLDARFHSLGLVLGLWTLAGLVTALLGLWQLRALRLGGWRAPVDRQLIRSGLRVSLAFLIATLALRGIQTGDRYWVEALAGIETAGAYVLFFGVASALMVFLDAGIFAFSYPQLIRLAGSGEHAAARRHLRQMLLQVVAVAAGFGLIAWALLPLLLDWIGKPLYHSALDLYPWLFAATVLQALSMVPHYALYARGKDRPIITSHLLALPVFALATAAAAPTQGALAVPIGLCAAFLLILGWKTLAWVLLERSTPPTISPPPVSP